MQQYVQHLLTAAITKLHPYPARIHCIVYHLPLCLHIYSRHILSCLSFGILTSYCFTILVNVFSKQPQFLVKLMVFLYLDLYFFEINESLMVSNKLCKVAACCSANVPSVLWRCWLGGRKGIRSVKNWVVGCWHGCLSGARCRVAYSPADATATHYLFASVKSRLVLPLWYRLTRVVPDKGPFKRVCVLQCNWACHVHFTETLQYRLLTFLLWYWYFLCFFSLM